MCYSTESKKLVLYVSRSKINRISDYHNPEQIERYARKVFNAQLVRHDTNPFKEPKKCSRKHNRAHDEEITSTVKLLDIQ